jgi:flagellar basal-body rod protein FlgB
MINNLFNSRTQIALEFALDATSTNSQLIAHNIANADTPNYKAMRLRFEDVLASRLSDSENGVGLDVRRTNPQHLNRTTMNGIRGIRTPHGLIYTDNKTTYRLDGNNIDMDHEMAQQAKNSLQYAVLTELINRRLSGLRTVISGGRR